MKLRFLQHIGGQQFKPTLIEDGGLTWRSEVDSLMMKAQEPRWLSSCLRRRQTHRGFAKAEEASGRLGRLPLLIR